MAAEQLGIRERTVRRVRERAANGVWPWTVLLGALAVAATLADGAQTYVADNRFELYWAPGQRFSKSFTIWDDSRGLGRIREEFRPVVAGVIWLLEQIGCSPALAERLWHSLLLTLAGLGAIVLVRALVPAIGAWAGSAGVLYAFAPYSSVFLDPSNLYMHYALAPWLAACAVWGISGRAPWRWAAVTALAVFSVGNADPPGLVYAVVPGIVAVAFLVFHERSVSARAALKWSARAFVLLLPISAAMLTKSVLASDAFAHRLLATEAPSAAATASSWIETARGLGFWVSYFQLRGDRVRPEEAILFSEGWLILMSGVPFVAALLALWWLRDRRRLLFASLLVLGAGIMVGAHPLDDPSPWGTAWLWATERVPGFASLRSTYKAGSVLMLGVVGLVAWGAADLVRRRPERSRPVGGALVAVAVLVAVPFWTGSIYSPDRRMDDVPSYWRDAMHWLDAQPGDGRALVLPGSTRAAYRWGSPGDDIHDALLARSHVVDIAIPLTTPAPADLIRAVDDAVVDGRYTAGSLAPVLQRIGVEYVVLRNDLAWEDMGAPRPADLTTIRRDPDLAPVATFGDPGQNTVGPVDAETPEERALPPVEIFRVRGDRPAAMRMAPGHGSILLEGGGDGWFRLSASGALDGDRPVVYPASLSDDELIAQARQESSTLVVTDTNRRRAVAVDVFDARWSHTLAPEEDLGRPVLELFDSAASQSVSTHVDASRISDPTGADSLATFRPEFRPEQAFDGDLATGWVVPPVPDATERVVRVDLRSPVELEGVDIVAFDPRDPLRAARGDSFRGVPRPGRLELRLSDGSRRSLNLLTGRGAVRFEPVTIRWLEVRIADVTDLRDVGIAEIGLVGPDLDLGQYIHVAHDAIDRARDVTALAVALRSIPTVYDFAREVGTGVTPIEVRLRRRFETVGAREFELRGTLAARPREVSSECVDVGIRIDDESHLVRLSSAAGSSAFVGCGPVALDDGTHRLVVDGDAVVDAVVLRTGEPPIASDAAESVDVVDRTDGARRVVVDAPGGGWLVGGDGFDERWTATLDGRPLGPPVMVDTQTAWRLPNGSERSVALVYGPAKPFRIAQWITAAAVGACVLIVVAPLRGRRRDR